MTATQARDLLFGWCLPGSSDKEHAACRQSFEYAGRTWACGCPCHPSPDSPATMDNDSNDTTTKGPDHDTGEAEGARPRSTNE